jgi:hypothetical protein
MSREQLAQIGAVLASHVDMIKGFLGDQFAVSVVARHQSGPFHLLLGDDSELALIGCLSELQRIGKHLVRVGEDGSVVPVQPGDPDEPTEWDHMVNLLREFADDSPHWSDPDQIAEFRQRVEQVLAMVEGPAVPTPQPEDAQLTEVRPAPFPPPGLCPMCEGEGQVTTGEGHTQRCSCQELQ